VLSQHTWRLFILENSQQYGLFTPHPHLVCRMLRVSDLSMGSSVLPKHNCKTDECCDFFFEYVVRSLTMLSELMLQQIVVSSGRLLSMPV